MSELIKSNYFLPYVIKQVRRTSLFTAARRAVTYSRRFFLIGRIIRYIGIAVNVIETSAALIFIAAVILVLIPLLLIALAAFTVADRIVGSRLIKSAKLSSYLSKKRIAVISEAGAFGEGFARELAENGTAVFVITGDPVKRFLCAREQNGVFYIRHAFYFRLKRKRLTAVSDRLIYLL